MIDWLTLKLDRQHMNKSDLEKLSDSFGRVVCINPDGTIAWEKVARESIRSDSHQLMVEVNPYELMLHGSPARVIYSNNVFGPGDPVQCAMLMINYAERHLGAEIPHDLKLWRVTRLDVTHNYDLGSPIEVRQALAYLRQSEGGHLQVRTKSESVYWNKSSALRGGKAYHKGPHLLYQDKKRQAEATEDQINLANRLLRLELCLRHQWWRERATKAWYEFSEQEIDIIHEEFFSKVIGKIEVIEMDNLLERFQKVAKTKGQGESAYRTWGLIKAFGLREAQSSMPKRTWYRHKQIMFDAGLTYADLHAQNIVPFRRRTIELGKPVRSWDELRRAA